MIFFGEGRFEKFAEKSVWQMSQLPRLQSIKSKCQFLHWLLIFRRHSLQALNLEFCNVCRLQRWWWELNLWEQDLWELNIWQLDPESSTSGTSVSTIENWTSGFSTSGTSTCGKKNPGNGTTRMLGNSPDAEKRASASNKEHVKSGCYGRTQCWIF